MHTNVVVASVVTQTEANSSAARQLFRMKLRVTTRDAARYFFSWVDIRPLRSMRERRWPTLVKGVTLVATLRPAIMMHDVLSWSTQGSVGVGKHPTH